ncbi:MAG: penicillin-binding protein 2, partial [Eggerthellaceae bacterium]|nr:penicillin-binding protein 2 [Eggerthellaceae bacterium]
GNSNIASFQDLIDKLAAKSKFGNNVKLSIDSNVQKVAENTLVGYKGAVVALNPKTGAVYAMASSPTYDPNNLEEEMNASNSVDSAMFNRFTQALYSPGSTFKIVSLTTALEQNVSNENRYYDAPGTMDFWGGTVSNFAKRSYGNVTLRRGFELSSNTVFAQLGVEIGANRLVEGAKNFGFEKDCGLEIPVVNSLMPEPSKMTNWELGWSAAGEPVGSHKYPPGPQVTVTQMALVASAIANNGIINTPHLVESISSPNGVKSYEASTVFFAQATSADIAQRVKECMIGVVENGTGVNAKIYGVTVAGKTGTAEKDNDKSNIWFVGFADANDPTVAIAVILEDAPENTAHVKAKEIMEAIFNKT